MFKPRALMLIIHICWWPSCEQYNALFPKVDKMHAVSNKLLIKAKGMVQKQKYWCNLFLFRFWTSKKIWEKHFYNP